MLSNILITRIFCCPESYHETFLERAAIRSAVLRATQIFFSQQKDDPSLVNPPSPLEPFDATLPLFSLGEVMIRSLGVAGACVGITLGLTMMFGSRRALGQMFTWGFFIREK